jgi:hypothetical protein
LRSTANGWALAASLCLLERERRDLPEAPHLPEEEHEERRKDGDPARETLAPAASHDVRERRAGHDEQVRRLEDLPPAPMSTPARAASVIRPGASERTTKYAPARTSTIDGKSDIAVSPSACGRNCSVQRSWYRSTKSGIAANGAIAQSNADQ